MRPALVLPGVAIGFAAVVLLGPGHTQPALGARVLATPAVAGRVPSARLSVVHRLDGAERPAAGVALQVQAGDATASGTTGADGVLEITFAPPPRVGTVLTVHTDGRELARGALDLEGGPAPSTQLALASGQSEGELQILLGPARGILVPPFEETLVARVLAGGRPVSAHLRVELTGASPALFELELDERGEGARFAVTAEAMRVDVEARATDRAGRSGAFRGSVETVPGALWLDPAAPEGEVHVYAPSPRPTAYLSLLGERGRMAGLVVPLAEDTRGFHRGAATLPVELRGMRLVAVAAGDVEERGPSTVAWPLSPPEGAATASRLGRVIDGVGAAEEAERARADRARRLAVVVAGICGALSVLFLLREGRKAQRALEEHLRAASAGGDREEALANREVAASAARAGSTSATLLGALIALAFGVVAAMIVVR